jgi:hypothetical protein
VGRQTWLADELRKAGVKVVEVSGWKTRGSETFNPVGVTWHATAGSRKSTAQGEVHVILTGSNTAPPPIAQIMLDRDGTAYVCAAGRCNHNKVGWAGPNKGLGNTSLFGIEMANANDGEPWPDVQLAAARKITAAIFRRIKGDPRKRLAAHYEHQPYVGRPAGEGSTKSDPKGVNMVTARAAVYKIMTGDDDVEISDLDKALRDGKTPLAQISKAIPWQYVGGGIPEGMSTLAVLNAIHGYSKAAAELIKIVAARDEVDEAKLGRQISDAMAPAVAALVTPVIADLLADGGATQLTADQIREATAMGVREVLRQGVDEDAQG